MSAAEFLANQLETRFGNTTTWAQHILDELKAAGYAVVELPEPDTFADDYAVVGNEIRHYAPNGFGAYWRFDFDEADTLARALLSLLAAADAAERAS